MSITVQLTSEEVAQIKHITKFDDEAEAISKAAREFLRITRLRELKLVTGKVAFNENW